MFSKKFLVAIVLAVSFATPVAAQDLLPRDNGLWDYHSSPRWRETESHPLRVLAYPFHAVGWVAREFIFRPFSAFAGSTEVTRSVMGFREPYDYREPLCFFDSDKVPDCRTIAPYSQFSDGASNVVETTEGMGVDDTASAAVSGERQVFFPDVNFEFDKSELNALGRGRVRQIAQLLASVPSVKVVVEGHTDNVGSDEYNTTLSQRRGAAVMQELSELGIDPARMETANKGEGEPIFSEDDDWAHAVNRRVEFSVQGNG